MIAIICGSLSEILGGFITRGLGRWRSAGSPSTQTACVTCKTQSPVQTKAHGSLSAPEALNSKSCRPINPMSFGPLWPRTTVGYGRMRQAIALNMGVGRQRLPRSVSSEFVYLRFRAYRLELMYLSRVYILSAAVCCHRAYRVYSLHLFRVHIWFRVGAWISGGPKSRRNTGVAV